jgi:hypothetical protein
MTSVRKGGMESRESEERVVCWEQNQGALIDKRVERE